VRGYRRRCRHRQSDRRSCSSQQFSNGGLDINAEEGDKTYRIIEEIGGKMFFIKTDLTTDEDIENAIQQAAGLGTITCLANIAGIQHIDSVDNFPMEKYDFMQRLMLRAPFYLAKLAIPHMKKSKDGVGIIGHMASTHAHICTKSKPVYNNTKFGLKALSQSIAAEGEERIRSFTLSTGFVKTPLALNQIPAQAEQLGSHGRAIRKDSEANASKNPDLT
jgi:3-hydroxybutyrate dehydrogenase